MNTTRCGDSSPTRAGLASPDLDRSHDPLTRQINPICVIGAGSDEIGEAVHKAVTCALAPTSAGYRASPGSRLDFARIADSARWAEESIAAVSASMFACSAYAALSGPCR
jgi:hypothetical protein